MRATATRSRVRRHRSIDIPKNTGKKPPADKGTEQLAKLKSAANKTRSEEKGATNTTGDSAKPAQPQKPASLIGRRRARSDESLNKGASSRAFPNNPIRQQVLVTLPHPTLVSPRRPSPSRRRQVPALLSGSAQETLQMVQQQQQQQQHSRRAPESPGDDLSLDEPEDQSSLSASSRRQQEQQQQSSMKNSSSSRKRSSSTKSRRSSSSSFRRSFASGEESAPDNKRISNFHVEVSESFSPTEDGDDLEAAHLGLPSIQLDPRNIAICVVAFAVVIVVALGAWLSPDSSPSDDVAGLPIHQDGSTLQLVRGRGFVKCGMITIEEGLNLEQCRAMALIALGDTTKYEPVLVDMDTRFELLANQTVDIVTEGTTFTM